MKRRNFIEKTAAAALGFSLLPNIYACATEKYPFTISLDPGSIGVEGDLTQVIEMAAKYGFDAVAPNADYIAKQNEKGMAKLLALLEDKKLVWGSTGLPFNFRGDVSEHKAGLKKLAKVAAKLQQAGVTRMGTWIYPAHHTLTYHENFRMHAERIRDICAILQDHNIRFGLEYVGPKTAVISRKFPFLHTMKETQELIAEINMPNAGLVLDAYHWYNAEEDKEDILTLSNQDIVSCDLNDAPLGRDLHEQLDLERELPAATGVIEVKSFLDALIQIGYDGPIRAEPFSKALSAMGNDEALKTTIGAFRKALGQ